MNEIDRGWTLDEEPKLPETVQTPCGVHSEKESAYGSSPAFNAAFHTWELENGRANRVILGYCDHGPATRTVFADQVFTKKIRAA